MAFIWSLNSKEKFTCPSCGHQKRFVRYINNFDGEWFPDESVGLCDRVDSCGHHYKPHDYFEDYPEDRYEIEGEYYDMVDEPIDDSYTILNIKNIGKYFTAFDDIFYWFLVDKFDKEKVNEVFRKYMVLSKDNYPVFMLYDINKNLRSGKIFPMNSSGHRINSPIWLHKYFKVKDFKLRICLFGEHLLNDLHKKVVVVESEKTAIVGAITKPEYIWVATGGANMLTYNNLNILANRDIIVLPDLSIKDKNGKTQFKRWAEKLIEISKKVEFKSWDITYDWYPEDLKNYHFENGWDYADFVLLKKVKNDEHD